MLGVWATDWVSDVQLVLTPAEAALSKSDNYLNLGEIHPPIISIWGEYKMTTLNSPHWLLFSSIVNWILILGVGGGGGGYYDTGNFQSMSSPRPTWPPSWPPSCPTETHNCQNYRRNCSYVGGIPNTLWPKVQRSLLLVCLGHRAANIFPVPPRCFSPPLA